MYKFACKSACAKALRSARSGCSLKYSRIAALSVRLEDSFASKPRISSSLSGGKSEMVQKKRRAWYRSPLGVLVLQAVNLLHRQFLGLALQGVHPLRPAHRVCLPVRAVLCCISVCIVCSICRCTALSISARCGYSVPPTASRRTPSARSPAGISAAGCRTLPISGIGGSFSVSAGFGSRSPSCTPLLTSLVLLVSSCLSP